MRLPKRGQIGLAHTDAVDQDRAALRIVEAHDQAENRGFARAGRADNGDPLRRN